MKSYGKTGTEYSTDYVTMERYSRQIMLPEIGEAGQRKLADAKVLIVGLGGLGCPVSLYLTGAGVGRIGLCDPDTVSLTNLQRQTLYGEDMVGEAKVSAAHRRLASLSADTEFELLYDGLTADNAAAVICRYDLIVDCCDNHATRYLIDDVCRELRKPWIYASIGEYTGCVSTFLPGEAGYADLYADRKKLEALPPSAAGVIGAVAGIIGSIEAAETIKLICGFGERLSNRLLVADIKSMTFRTIEL